MTYEEELIEQVNNLQRCMSEQRDEYREQRKVLGETLTASIEVNKDLHKRIAELEKENAELRQRKGNRVILMDKIPHHTSGGDL